MIAALTLVKVAIFRFVEEQKKPVSAVLEEGVYSAEKSPLFQLRGQIWEEVVQPRILEVLDKYWRKLAKKGRTLEEAARYKRTEPDLTLTTTNVAFIMTLSQGCGSPRAGKSGGEGEAEKGTTQIWYEIKAEASLPVKEAS